MEFFGNLILVNLYLQINNNELFPFVDVATVRVKIGDENDNPPNFEKTIYYANVNEDAFISSIVTTVEAKDRDGEISCKKNHVFLAWSFL